MKDKILAASTRLFARNGFSGTSLQSIAEEVGVRKPSLLYHFPSKQALRQAVISDLLTRWQNRLPRILAAANGGTRRFDAVFHEVAGFFRADPNRARLILREVVDRPHETRDLLGTTIAPWSVLLTDSIRQGQAAGTVRPEVNPESWLIEVVILVIGTFAAADLAGAVFAHQAETAPEDRINRQMEEIIRMARTSLYTPSTLAKQANTPVAESEKHEKDPK